jgi:NodT family efflux transporter outer membrane factor (OMF) lipoprotein
VTSVLIRIAPRWLVLLLVLASSGGCMVGPDYRPPVVPTQTAWIAGGNPAVHTDVPPTQRWWDAFDDPVVGTLVERAYAQNLTLEASGLRVLQAQAQRGVAVGGLYPQSQALRGLYARNVGSQNTGVPFDPRAFDTFRAGFDVAWEVDLWGRFRRGIEAADEDLLASLADYDDVLTSLVGQVVSTYVQIRVSESRLALAQSNVLVQRDSLRIAEVRFEAGGTTQLDVQQALTQLTDTEALIPERQIEIAQGRNALAVLLGIPPAELGDMLGPATGIPAAPPTVAVGIPADLIRRRPDVRAAERRLAAQSARIGVAFADLFPRVQLVGSVGLNADDAAKFFQGRAFEAVAGPQFDWPILNYGRLINQVRVQDAAFQAQVADFTNTVLVAQQEVENALVGYTRGAEQVGHLVRSVGAANNAVDLATIQYREGATDFTTVLTAQQAKLEEDDSLALARGGVTQSVIDLYRALGGGWELRAGQDVVREDLKPVMAERTWWGDMLDADQRATDADPDRDDEPNAIRSWWPQW